MPIGSLITDFSDPVYLILDLAILLLVFLILREILCWYWKINKIVSLLEDIKKNTSPQVKNPEMVAKKVEEIQKIAVQAQKSVTEPKTSKNFFSDFATNKTKLIITFIIFSGLLIYIGYIFLNKASV